MSDTALEAVLRRDRSIVVGGLVAVVVLAWIYILSGAGMGMSAFETTAVSGGEVALSPDTPRGAMAGLAMNALRPAQWTPGYAVLMFFMWWVMMVAMMLPSAAQMILLYARIDRRQRERGAPIVPTGIFASGYVAAWGTFGIIAVGLQWGLERAELLSSMMASPSAGLGGALWLAAGIWQLTPLKHACLRHCRTPLQFLSHHWRKGRFGAFAMGVEHGAFCLGCCWVLMALLFYGGVMNLYWIAGLALFVLAEKTVPRGHWLGSAAGVGLMAWGALLLWGSLA